MAEWIVVFLATTTTVDPRLMDDHGRIYGIKKIIRDKSHFHHTATFSTSNWKQQHQQQPQQQQQYLPMDSKNHHLNPNDTYNEDEDDRKPAAKTPNDSIPETDIPVKPALILRNGKKPKKAPKHLKWDEQAIEEHDQLRGTRMKIDEPNTPYTYYSDSGAESDDSRKHCKSPAQQKPSLSWDTLETRLNSVANVREQYASSPTSSIGGAETDQSDVEEERKKEMRRLEFRDHRKRHYDEYQMIQKFRQEHPEDFDEDNDDDEDDNHNDADVEDES